MDFYLKELSYSRDLLRIVPPSLALNNTPTPIDILRSELRNITRTSHITSESLCKVETSRWWYEDPAEPEWLPKPRFLDRDMAVTFIKEQRLASKPQDIWIFTDGSLIQERCGSAALIYQGPSITPQIHSVHFSGFHSSTQTELRAIELGCEQATIGTACSCATIVSDSQGALLATQKRQGGSALSVRTREALRRLSTRATALRLLWVPGHAGLPENERADSIAKEAALSRSASKTTHTSRPCPLVTDVPHSRASLKRLLHQHYARRFETQYTNTRHHHDELQLPPHFSPSLKWTQTLTRKETALAAQFLTGHFPVNAYLFRFHLRDDPGCSFCESDYSDRSHILFSCPKFEYLRQQLASDIWDRSSGCGSWSWDYLSSPPGRPYLARFLTSVHRALLTVH